MLHRYYAIEAGANANSVHEYVSVCVCVCVCVSYKSANKAQPVINPELSIFECKGIRVFVNEAHSAACVFIRVSCNLCVYEYLFIDSSARVPFRTLAQPLASPCPIRSLSSALSSRRM